VFLLGIFGGGKILGLIATNGADNILHLVIAVVLLYGGFGKMQSGAGAPTTT
jgi:hypothetical protein